MISMLNDDHRGLLKQVKRGVLYTSHESEGRRLRNPCDTIVEGVGLNRLTGNFKEAHIDDAFQCTDQEAVDMAMHLLHSDGLWLGSSSCVNCVGAVKAARALGPGHMIVTILCDGGHRHMSRFYNEEVLVSMNLQMRSPSPDLSWIA
jgi:cysteine synthase